MATGRIPDRKKKSDDRAKELLYQESREISEDIRDLCLGSKDEKRGRMVKDRM